MSNLELGLREAGLWDDIVAGMQRTGLSLTQFLRASIKTEADAETSDEYLVLFEKYKQAFAVGNEQEAVQLYTRLHNMVPFHDDFTAEEMREYL